MISRYNESKTIKGEATSTILIGTQKVVILNTFQIERPRKLYLRQDVVGTGLSFVVVSDGKEFSYQVPEGPVSKEQNSRRRLTEDFTPALVLGDVYRVAAQSLAERSSVLDLLISDSRDLVTLRDQWATVQSAGKVELNGENVNKIVGKWRLNRLSEITANYSIFVAPSGDLRKYVIEQAPGIVALGKQDFDGVVTRSCEVKAIVDSELDPKMFIVLK